MELIQALEQLSLEIRNQQQTNEIVNKPGCNNGLSATIETHNKVDWQYPACGSNQSMQQHINSNQLENFDDSIKTLLAQINDLDCIEQNQHFTGNNNKNCPPAPAISKPAPGKRNLYKSYGQQAARSHMGSMETSQEEDSDCSSQRSSATSSNNSSGGDSSYVNPLVKDLLKRDLSTITDTVRKISQILAIGNEIETIFYSFLDDSAKTNPVQQHIDYNYCRSLCDSYMNLCASEPHIRDLPTITRYNNCCFKLLSRIDGLCADGSNQHVESRWHDGGMELAETINDEDDDVTFLSECDQGDVNNWTDNKLYMGDS